MPADKCVSPPVGTLQSRAKATKQTTKKKARRLLCTIAPEAELPIGRERKKREHYYMSPPSYQAQAPHASRVLAKIPKSPDPTRASSPLAPVPASPFAAPSSEPCRVNTLVFAITPPSCFIAVYLASFTKHTSPSSFFSWPWHHHTSNSLPGRRPKTKLTTIANTQAGCVVSFVCVVPLPRKTKWSDTIITRLSL